MLNTINRTNSAESTNLGLSKQGISPFFNTKTAKKVLYIAVISAIALSLLALSVKLLIDARVVTNGI